MQKDLDLLRVRLIECREPREYDVWLHSAVRVAAAINPFLARDDARAVWSRVQASPCFPTLKGAQREWIGLLHAVAARDAARMAILAEGLLATQPDLVLEAREYLLMAALTGRLAAHEPAQALRLWNQHAERVRASTPAFRLLRCRADSTGCVTEFARSGAR
jgi:hypothetical protein